MSDWFHNGNPTDSVSVDDRAVQYGDGVFETIAIRDARPRFWGLHVDRLQAACDRLGLRLPAESLLERDLERALAQSTVNTGFCTAKIVVTAGVAERGYRRDKDSPGTTLVGIFDGVPEDRSSYENGVESVVCETHLSEQPRLAGLKTLNRLEQVLAGNEEATQAVFEGFMCDAAGRVVCGTRTNVFLIRDNHITTPDLSRCGVAGIMRRRIISQLAENDIDASEADVSLDELGAADEVFLCNSQFGVVPVRRCGDLEWPIGECTRSVMTMLSYEHVPECRP